MKRYKNEYLTILARKNFKSSHDSFIEVNGLSSFPAHEVDVELPVYPKSFKSIVLLQTHVNSWAEKMAFEQRTLLITVSDIDLSSGLQVLQAINSCFEVKHISITKRSKGGVSGAWATSFYNLTNRAELGAILSPQNRH